MSKSGGGIQWGQGEQGLLFGEDEIRVKKALTYPRFRYMGSKHKLIPWIYDSLKTLPFDSVLDGFAGSGVVSYTFKTMGKEVISNDFLRFSHLITKATCENSHVTLKKEDISVILEKDEAKNDFITSTFEGIFFTKPDLEFLDQAYWNIKKLGDEYKKAVALTSLIRACIKKQPRGVFTVSGDLSNYNDGRRDLRLSIQEHFLEQVSVVNDLIFNNGKKHQSFNTSIFNLELSQVPDLVYLDPPYVPKSDDNCYVKRYHFLEGLSKYWEGEKIMETTKVKKIPKKYTPFSYRSKAVETFDQLFEKFQESIIVLSYSNNGFPDLKTLKQLLSKYKKEINVLKKPHKYHFGNHSKVKRSIVEEYLIIGK